MDTSRAALASNPPPTSGDWFLHGKYGRVRLIRQAGGASWVCHCHANRLANFRPILNPSDMEKIEPPR
jgi:hypothetical protein